MNLLSATPDKGKDTAAVLDWNDPEAFREILRKRIVTSTGQDETFDRLWLTYFDTHVCGEEGPRCPVPGWASPRRAPRR
jgi:hypothetical protein